MRKHMILQKIYTKLLEYTRDIDVDYSFWGNDTVDSFQYNFDYNSYHHLFELNQDLSDKILKVFIIAGPLNLNQEAKLLKEIEATESEDRLVIKLRGSITEEDLNKSYFYSGKSLIDKKIDFKINKFPYDLNEIVDFLSQKVRAKLKC